MLHGSPFKLNINAWQCICLESTACYETDYIAEMMTQNHANITWFVIMLQEYKITKQHIGNYVHASTKMQYVMINKFSGKAVQNKCLQNVPQKVSLNISNDIPISFWWNKMVKLFLQVLKY